MSEIIAVVAIVERGKADYVVNRAKKVGAQGATILYGRGTGESEAKKFLNVHIESSKEIIIILTEKEKCKQIFDEVVEAGRLKEPGTGIIFTFPVSNLVGLHHREDFSLN
ncbi:P-II family nitrogen regulator [Tepidanaerobacter acetatoxydans]|uniref:P-II family nitrogen regulator n=1 Tax=Tepidanaerobacter acetatoxydans TaxID=499229 RepID=UPI001BD4531B|nr:P-II family nitrogen regulator [Tepidanaerobacter acetatoxydans]